MVGHINTLKLGFSFSPCRGILGNFINDFSRKWFLSFRQLPNNLQYPFSIQIKSNCTKVLKKIKPALTDYVQSQFPKEKWTAPRKVLESGELFLSKVEFNGIVTAPRFVQLFSPLTARQLLLYRVVTVFRCQWGAPIRCKASGAICFLT